MACVVLSSPGFGGVAPTASTGSRSWAKVIAQILAVSLGGEGPSSERPAASPKAQSKADGASSATPEG